MSSDVRMCAIDGFPRYAVSEDGRVFSFKANRWLKPRIHRQGYILAVLYRKGSCVGYQRLVSRLVAAAFIPNPADKPEVNHIDGDKANNHYSNLEWATRLENQRHATSSGLWKPHYGEAHGMSKLTEQGVRYIKSMRGKALSRVVAAEFGVSPTTVQLIWKGRSWQQVQP